MSLENLYQEILLEHYRRPRNFGVLKEADVHEHGVNPLCGDEIEITLKVENGRVADVRFQGKGCSISKASASMMTEAVRGMSLEEIRQFVDEMEKVLKGEKEGDPEKLGDLEALKGVSKFPVRIKCALLAWKVLEQGLERASGKGDEKEPS